MDITKTLFKLCSLSQIGNIAECTDYIKSVLNGKARVTELSANTLAATFKGDSDYTLMLDAHIDQIGMVVTDVDTNGFVKVANVGGIDLRTLPAKSVKILGKQTVGAVFCSIPPHLKKEDADFTDISKLTLDTGFGKDAQDIISVGDYAVYSTTPAELLSNRVTAPFLDNRAGVTALLLLADYMANAKLPINVTLLFSTEEELGCRRAKTASFSLNPNEAIAVDVTFGTDPAVNSAHGGELSKGPMVGISPFLSHSVTSKLISVAEQNSIDFQKEVMGGATSTNADVIAVTKSGIKCGLLSVPLRNMHTNVEVVDITDINLTAKLLLAYIMAGGANK